MSGVMYAGMERREAERFFDPPVQSRVESESVWKGVRILNISKTGLRFSSDVPFTKGLNLVFGMVKNGEKAKSEIKVDGTILNDYGKKSGAGYEYGIKFNMPANQALDRYIDSMYPR